MVYYIRHFLTLDRVYKTLFYKDDLYRVVADHVVYGSIVVPGVVYRPISPTPPPMSRMSVLCTLYSVKKYLIHYIASKSVLNTLYSVKKCLIDPI